MAENLNEVVEEVVSDAQVMTVPIDDTLSISGEAADAKAVGDALDLKADKSAVVAIDVNGQAADNQGHILIDGTDIPMSGTDTTTLKAKIEAVDGKTGATIPLSAAAGAPTIADAIEDAGGKSAENIPMTPGGATMIAAKIAAMDATDIALNDASQAMSGKTASDIKMSALDSTTVKDAIEARVKSVNGIMPDSDGDVYVDEVPFADNLRSSQSQNTVGTFNLRTAGGSASIEDGSAWLTGIRGNRVHTGYIPETLNMTVSPVEREVGEDTISATIDRDIFVAYVQSSGTITLAFTSSWSADPDLYGIEITGTPKNGDVITVVYVQEVRGTITQTTPTSFVATGWNLYNHALGYARAVKYSDVYGYCVEGTYTAVKFSTTPTGEKSTITPIDGYFNVSSNGYIWIEGGNATDTQVYLTWSDWQDTDDHPAWEAYTETVIDLEDTMDAYFPHGLLRVGDIRDEIDLNVGLAISNVERLAYSAENIEMAKATGRTYEADTNYIYLERANPVISELALDGSFTSSDHGIEYFVGSSVPVYAVILYGNNLKNKLERDVLTKSSDLVDNLTTNDATKALSAAQGYNLNNNLASFAKTISTGTKNFTSSTSWFYTGISITIPAKSVYFVRGECAYQTNSPHGVALSFSSSPNGYDFKSQSGGDSSNRCGGTSLCGYTTNALTIYMHAKYADTGASQGSMSGAYIPFN